jgi:hypothetical protein
MPPIEELPIRDIHLPETIGWFPPAIGWWILAFLIPVCTFLIIILIKRLRQKTAVKLARKLIKQLEHDDKLSDRQKVCEISSLLRRVAISTSQQGDDIAGLTGRAWLDYLDQPLKEAGFKHGVGRYLIEAPYQQTLSPEVDLKALFQLAHQWLNAQPSTLLKQHKKLHD